MRIVMAGDYDEGRRDAEIKQLKIETRDIWAELKAVRGWQNRAIGYIAAVATIATLLIQYLMRKFGA